MSLRLPLDFTRRSFALALAAALLAGIPALPATAQAPPAGDKLPPEGPQPSSMGALFMGLTPLPSWIASRTRPTPPSQLYGPAGIPPVYAPQGVGGNDLDVTPGIPRFQSETTIAAAGDTVVVGFNDATGFSNPSGLSVSGFSWSHDGGQTFTYGGQLPTAGNQDVVRGDPDVKAWRDPGTGNLTFVYSSIYQTAGGSNSLCVHVSTDGGVTWSGPREITSATSSTAFADKEFIDVDPETGRVMVSWTSFTSGAAMMTSYSDDFGLSWSPAVTFGSRPVDGQGSCPRFDPGSDRAYIAWRAYSPNTISLVTSTDNGVSWSSPVDIAGGINDVLPPYGSDRINGFPALSVSPADGSLHVVYASRTGADFGDVLYTSSSDGGGTWSAPVVLNPDPGGDRAQFFPWVTAAADGGVDATWFDQRAGSGTSDLTEIMHAHSEDGGSTWSCPAPLTPRPFHAEYGQDTGQPNLGDYSQCASQMVGSVRTLYSSYARTDGADYQTDWPDTYVAVNAAGPGQAAVELAGTAINDVGCAADGYLVADEIGDLTLTLRNACGLSLTGISADLAVSTPLVDVVQGTSSYPTLAPQATGANGTAFRIRLDPAYPCGQDIDCVLSGSSDQGAFTLGFTLPTGVAESDTLLLDENFDGVASGLPGGWGSVQRKGVINIWHVSTDYSVSGNKSVFCADYPDTNWSRLQSPNFVVPNDADYLEVTFDVTYDNEAVGDGRQGFDGTLLKINVDGADVLAGAFSTQFDEFYPTQIVRSSGATANPLQDLAAWSGNVLPDFSPIRIRYPGLAGHTVRLAFEMGSDGSVGGTGTYIDDVRVRAVRVGCGPCTAAPILAVSPQQIVFPQVAAGQTLCDSVVIRNNGDGYLDVNSVTGCNGGQFSLDLTGLSAVVLPGGSTAFQVCVTGEQPGADSCSVIISTNAGEDTVRVNLGEVTAVGDLPARPASLTLIPVRPNPIRAAGTVAFSLPDQGPVRVTVFDLSGRRVRTLAAGEAMSPGPHRLVWDGRDDRGSLLGSGIYFVRVAAGGAVRTTRAVLLR